MTPDSTQPVRRLPRPSPLALLRSGRKALREVPRLRVFLLKGYIINYSLFLVTAALAYYVIFFFFVEPYVARMDEWITGEGFFWKMLALLLNVLVWLTQLLLLAGTVMLSLLFSLAMMSIWLEGLAARIVAHCRGGTPPEAFSLVEWVISLGAALRDSLSLMALAIAALLLGFIPVVGPLLVILVDSYLLGWEIRDPYLVVRQAAGDPRKQMRKGLILWTVKAGFIPVVLAMIPVVGWVLLPLVMIYMVAGFAWQGEQDLLEHKA